MNMKKTQRMIEEETRLEQNIIKLFKEGLKLKEIGKIVGLSSTTVSNKLVKHGYHAGEIRGSKVKVIEPRKSPNHPLEDWELKLLNEMKLNGYPEDRMAYMLNMSVDYLKKEGYL